MIRKNIAHWVKQGAGEQVWFVPNSWGSEGESKPQEILQFFPHLSLETVFPALKLAQDC